MPHSVWLARTISADGDCAGSNCRTISSCASVAICWSASSTRIAYSVADNRTPPTSISSGAAAAMSAGVDSGLVVDAESGPAGSTTGSSSIAMSPSSPPPNGPSEIGSMTGADDACKLPSSGNSSTSANGGGGAASISSVASAATSSAGSSSTIGGGSTSV